MIRQFDKIIVDAAKRKGGLSRLEHALAVTPTPALSVVAAITDDRILAEITRWVFYAGFSSRIVDAKWPAFEEAFQVFDLRANAFVGEDQLDALIQDRRIVRNIAKIRAVQVNARLILHLAASHGSAARFLAQWPDEDYASLLNILRERGSHLSGHAAMRFLRAIGKPAFITTDDVLRALIREGVIARPPRSRDDLAAVQAAFNTWAKQSGYNLTEVSRILAMSVEGCKR